MPDSKVRLEIVTPDSTVYSEIVEHAVVPTANGKIDLFQRHAPLIDRLEPADAKIVKDGKTEYLAVSSGFVEVYAEKVSIITDQAILIDEDDQEKIEEAVKRAEEALDEGEKATSTRPRCNCSRQPRNTREPANLPRASLLSKYPYFHLPAPWTCLKTEGPGLVQGRGFMGLFHLLLVPLPLVLFNQPGLDFSPDERFEVLFLSAISLPLSFALLVWHRLGLQALALDIRHRPDWPDPYQLLLFPRFHPSAHLLAQARGKGALQPLTAVHVSRQDASKGNEQACLLIFRCGYWFRMNSFTQDVTEHPGRDSAKALICLSVKALLRRTKLFRFLSFARGAGSVNRQWGRKSASRFPRPNRGE